MLYKDLLKCIQYFASTYYNERGQLFNGSREFRQQRKQNKLMRLQQEKEVRSASLPSRGSPNDGDQEEEEALERQRRGGRVKGAGKVIHRKDMYKVMDGSVLMVIGSLWLVYDRYDIADALLEGMLLQEYVADLLEVRIPEGWEESFRKAHAELDGQDSNEHSDGNEDYLENVYVDDQGDAKGVRYVRRSKRLQSLTNTKGTGRRKKSSR